MESRLKYPIGEQDFAGIREEGKVYVDKTARIFQLVNDIKYVFLSRPRRFGKSLLLSTLRYFFEGRKDLFEGLEIMNLEKDWKRYPVLHLELSRIDPNNSNSLKSALDYHFSEWEEIYGVNTPALEPAQRFENIIRNAYKKTGNKVVVLVDEYDNPLLNSIDNKATYETNQSLLKSVYSNIKALDGFIRFGMLTGVSRFSNLSIFSGINNLDDITLDSRYSDICGFTEEEIKRYLFTGVEALAKKDAITPQEALKLLKKEYDGYHFSKQLIDVYNPFSLLNCLNKSEIGSYWVSSGVPGFLVRMLEESRRSFEEVFNAESDAISLASEAVAFESPVALLFQTGYLTIKNYIKEDDLYQLGIPNREVDRGLFYFMLGQYTGKTSGENTGLLREMTGALKEGKAELFLEKLQALIAGISYQLSGKFTELDFERIMFVIFHILGYHVHCEFNTSFGRIDLTIETERYVYLFELKLDKSADEAILQIESKEYALGWKAGGREVLKIGVNFSSAKRNIESWKICK